jgi:hypothetical protein
LASQAKTGGLEDHISLDVHSIDELKNKGVKPTDDHFKYIYSANKEGEYSFEGCQGKVLALRRNKQFVDQVNIIAEFAVWFKNYSNFVCNIKWNLPTIF